MVPPWYRDPKPEHASPAGGVTRGVPTDKLTLAAVSQHTRAIAGYIFASFFEPELTIVHCKMDSSYHGGGIGRLVIKGAETYAKRKGLKFVNVKLETHEPARKCYKTAGFK